MSRLLEVRGLGVRFPVQRSLGARLARRPSAVHVLCDVSLDVERGQTVALVGESGSGKSTLARAVVGLVRAQQGSIRLDGREILGSVEGMRAARRTVAMTFQDPVGSLSPRLTVRALLLEALHLRRLAPADRAGRAAELLSLVGLSADLLGRFPHELSGGQARRVGVARALALEPALLLADEPTSGLDVSVQGEILNLLADVQRRLGLALLLICHDMAVVRVVADRVAVLYLGRVVEEGPVAAVLGAPRHPYTRALLAASPPPDPDLPAIEPELSGDVPSLLRRPPGCELHGRCLFAQERCRQDAPPLVEEAGRSWRCHYPLPTSHDTCNRLHSGA
jgi:oligopeptide/dipeptide ABC transporter ATP-binding protein